MNSEAPSMAQILQSIMQFIVARSRAKQRNHVMFAHVLYNDIQASCPYCKSIIFSATN